MSSVITLHSLTDSKFRVAIAPTEGSVRMMNHPLKEGTGFFFFACQTDLRPVFKEVPYDLYRISGYPGDEESKPAMKAQFDSHTQKDLLHHYTFAVLEGM